VNSTVQTIRVVIASPADVAIERECVENVARQVNRTIAADRDLRLEVGRWEVDAFPGFHLTGPQGICDNVLRIHDCDLLVAIFWTRFGTETLDGQTGTEHEINDAIASWRSTGRPQVMVFFNNAAPKLKSARERRQWTEVAAYRERFPSDGLFWEYEGAEDFERNFRVCIENYLRNTFPVASKAMETNGAEQTVTPEQDPILEDEITVHIDPRIPPEKARAFLLALADFYTACGAIGFEVDITAHRNKVRDTDAG
jgi:hypothetical protein